MDKRAYYQKVSVGETYDKIRIDSASGQVVQDMELDVLRTMLPTEGRILELACGTGRLMKVLRQEGRDVRGVDQSIAMMQAGGLNSETIQVGDVFCLRFPENSWDGAYCFRLMNHYREWELFLKEGHRILKKGGHFVFDSMRWSFLLWDMDSQGGRNYPISDRQIERLLAAAGFTVEDKRPLFLISPYLLGFLPFWVTHGIHALSRCVPKSWHSVVVWHVRKTR